MYHSKYQWNFTPVLVVSSYGSVLLFWQNTEMLEKIDKGGKLEESEALTKIERAALRYAGAERWAGRFKEIIFLSCIFLPLSST